MPMPPHKLSFGSPVLTLALAALLGLFLVRACREPGTPPAPASPSGPPAEAVTGGPATHATAPGWRSDLGPEERTTIAIYRRVSPSVVSVANKALVRAGFFSFQLLEVPQGVGSGFVWDRQGHIISNYHVVHEADALTVTFADGASFDARLVGVAPDYDLAVLKIDAPAARLQPVATGTSHDLLVGQTVLAIGNPYGLDTSLSLGVISALGRSITAMTERKIHEVIQTDAAINPGNSGGPLLDSSGRLIGINTAMLSPSGSFAGIGFAVPVDTIARVVPQLIAHGHLIRAGLGVQLLSDELAVQAGVEGAAVYAVPSESPAALAGIEGVSRTRRGDLALGDVVVGINGQAVRCVDDLRVQLDRLQPGAVVKVQLERGHAHRSVSVKLVEEE